MFLTSEEKNILDAYRALSTDEKAFTLALVDYERALPHMLQQRSEFTSRLASLLATDGEDKSLLIRR
jgi:hypothetical protein